MFTSRHPVVAGFLVTLLMFPGLLPAQAGMKPALQALSLEDAINVAGRQRMLSQRMVKAYCQLGLNVAPADAAEELSASMARFDRQLASLRRFSRGALLIEAVDEVERLWKKQRALLEATPDRAHARRAQYQAEQLLHASHMVVLILQDQSGDRLGELVNISGRQRMLSQRLAKLYLLRSLGVDTISVRDQTEQAMREFERVHAVLKASPLNTADIDIELRHVDTQWEWFTAVLHDFRRDANYGLIVSDASEKVLQSMERVTEYYAHIGR